MVDRMISKSVNKTTSVSSELAACNSPQGRAVGAVRRQTPSPENFYPDQKLLSEMVIGKSPPRQLPPRLGTLHDLIDACGDDLKYFQLPESGSFYDRVVRERFGVSSDHSGDSRLTRSWESGSDSDSDWEKDYRDGNDRQPVFGGKKRKNVIAAPVAKKIQISQPEKVRIPDGTRHCPLCERSYQDSANPTKSIAAHLKGCPQRGIKPALSSPEPYSRCSSTEPASVSATTIFAASNLVHDEDNIVSPDSPESSIFFQIGNAVREITVHVPEKCEDDCAYAFLNPVKLSPNANYWICPVPGCSGLICSKDNDPSQWKPQSYNGHLRSHGGRQGAWKEMEEKNIEIKIVHDLT